MLPPEPDPKQDRLWFIRILRGTIIIAAFGVILLALLGSPWLIQLLWPSATASHSSAFAQQTSSTSSPQPAVTESVAPTPTSTPFAPAPFEIGGTTSLDGLMVVSLSESGYSQLFSHQLLGQPFTRLTSGAWDDVDPAISPDGQRVAFASDRNGAWDLYFLDLLTGHTVQITDDAEYDGNPSWSPDGAWLAYEHFADNNQEIYMRPLDGSVDPVPISARNGADYAPVWRPSAQQIAFVSDRGGLPQIWLVDLEAEGDSRFLPLIENKSVQNSPAWSPDGSWLAWSQQDDGAWTIYIQNFSDASSSPLRIGPGEHPHWSFSGSAILAELHDPNQTYITAYTLSGGIAVAPEQMPGPLDGLAWGVGALADPLPEEILAAAQVTPQTISANTSGDATVDLDGVNAPFDKLNEAAIPSFNALRSRAAQLLGWDALSQLSNAFVPLDQPLSPDRQQDWLYTGRAFELHSGLLDAGWMAIVREDLEGQTYWRVYLKAVGDLGRPMTDLPWDLNARFNQVESDYQAGGQVMETLPAGLWLDFTSLASEFGFERVPALANWRSYYQGALFNQFVFRQGLSWEEAMLQLYSADEIDTLQP
jgi:TolB protein